MRGPADDIAAAIAVLSPVQRPGAAPVRPTLGSEVLEEATDILGPGPVSWAVEWSARALEVIVRQEAERTELPVLAIRRAAEALLLEILARLGGHDFQPGVADNYRQIAASAAEQAVSFETVVHSIRDCQRMWLEQLLSRVRTSLAAEALAALTLTVAEVTDIAITRIVGAYLAEQDRLAQGRAARRRSTVQAVLERRPVGTDRIEGDLGLTLADHHIGVVLWRPGGATGARLSRVAAQLAGRVPGATLLTVAADGEYLWAWLSRVQRPNAREWQDLVSVRPGLEGTRVALGPPASGTEGFRRTHLQALDAARVAQARPGPDDVIDWQAISLLATAHPDPERVRWFIEETLGPLAAHDRAAAEHRATLLSYLHSSQSLVRTAEEQHVHRNTVVYRLRRIEELLPMPLADHRLQIHLALQLADGYDALLE
ncbi:PucR family transcriptional regulator [Streptomyces sp. NPDC101776]|uniref:PucR family transcriptional regulator n=1 Tax=Streptomyces sp. NPDC101776 TaxID=3366146 RepID=UPI00380D2C64